MIELLYKMIEQTKLGATLTGSSFISGMLLKFEPEIMHSINHILQMIAFLVTIVVGVLTIIGWFNKRKRENRK